MSRNSVIRLHLKNSESETNLSLNPNIFSLNNTTDIIYSIESLCLPKTYYNFFETQQIEFIDSTTVVSNLSFIKGNYTLNEFFDQLVLEMSAIDPLLTFTWQQIQRSDLIEILASGPGLWSLEFLSQPLANYSGAILGKLYPSNSSTFTVLLDNLPNFERTCNFVLTSNLRSLNSTSYDNINDDYELTNKNNIIGVFPTKFEQTLISDLEYHKSYYGNFSTFIQTGPRFTTPIQIQLRDDDLNLIDLNGNDWTIDLILRSNF